METNNNTNEINNELPKQYVYNYEFSNEQIEGFTYEDFANVKHSWVVKKMYKNTNFGGQDFEFEEGKLYPGFITDYTLSKVFKEEKSYYYIKFYCTIEIEDYGIHGLTYEVNANYTTNSYFSRLLFNLGFNPSGCNEFCLDNLINLPIFATISTRNDYKIITDMKFRSL